jgi:hypothetical protein
MRRRYDQTDGALLSQFAYRIKAIASAGNRVRRSADWWDP